MPGHYRDGQHDRARAEECRRLAAQMPASEAREKMLQVAAGYERMADRAANRDVSESTNLRPIPKYPSRDDTHSQGLLVF
jgi:hypothetical protein